MLMAVCHSNESGWTTVEDLQRLSDLRAAGQNLLWAEADVSQLHEDDVRLIAEEFDLHPLAVEDAIHTRQRPKVEAYAHHLFVVIHQLDEVESQLEAVQIACFVGDAYLLAIHAGAERTMSQARRRWEEPPPPDHHPSYLLHTLLDVVVDEYQAIADRLEHEMEELEELVLESPSAPIERQLYSLKQRLARLRRYVLPASRILDWIVDSNAKKPIPKDAMERFRDIHDHVLRISDQERNVEDLSQAVLDLRRSAQANSLNEVTKRLTAWAAIIAVPTLIGSVYGMNFRLVPPDQSLFGFWFAVTLMLVASLGLFVFFRKRGWL